MTTAPEAPVEMPTHESAGRDFYPGEFVEPTAPLLPPPAGVDYPADLASALAAWRAAYDAWRDAVEAIEDYQAEAQMSRTKRAAAIRAAGQAVADGKKRPTIPKAISADEEATEVAVLKVVIGARYRDAQAASAAATLATMRNASHFIAPLVEKFAPAVEEARAAVAAAVAAVQRAETLRAEVARQYGMAHAAAFEAAGARLTNTTVPMLIREYAAAAVSDRYRTADRGTRTPLHLLVEARDAVEHLAATDFTKTPHPDTVKPVGATDEQARIAREKVRAQAA